MKTFLLASSALTLAWCAPAFAQSESNSTNADQAEPGLGRTLDHDQSIGVEDIVVTAERREQTAQRSSLSMEVFAGERLAAVSKPQDLTSLSPGVVVANRGSSPQVFIRGVGDQAANNTGLGAVAFNVDGIYYSRQNAVGPAMFDLQRMEILKGPQGTLYGRNATAGAVNVITHQPSLGGLDGYLSAEVGSFDLVRVVGALNLPVGPDAAIRIAGQVTARDGYLSTGLNDERTRAIRGRFLFEPSDRVSVLLNGDYSQAKGKGGGFAIYPVVDGDPWRGSTQEPLLFPYLFNPGTAPLTSPDDSVLDSENVGVSLEVNADLGFATLTIIPAYRYQDILAVQYSTNLRYAEHPTTDQWTGEVRLSNESSALKWVVGAYYYNEDVDLPASATLGALIGTHTRIQREALAGFAQATYSVTDAFRLIAGGRYTSEKIGGSFNAATGAINVPSRPYTDVGAITTVTPITDNKFNYKLGAEFDVADDSMAYLTYATGFKAGGFNSTSRCGAIPYDPEDLEAFTAGIKNRFVDGRLQLNAEAFHWKYKNQQFTIVRVDDCGDPGQLIFNPGDATIKGANVDMVFRLTRSDTIRGSLEYADATYDSFQLQQLGAQIYAPGNDSLCSAAPAAGNPGFFDIDCSGQRLARTPKWSGTAGYQHVFAVGDGEIVFDADAQFASKRWMDAAYVPNGLVDGYFRLSSQLTYYAPRDAWSLGVFVDNITNEAVYTGGLNIASTDAANGFNYYVNAVEAPRTFGARLRVNFGG